VPVQKFLYDANKHFYVTAYRLQLTSRILYWTEGRPCWKWHNCQNCMIYCWSFMAADLELIEWPLHE